MRLIAKEKFTRTAGTGANLLTEIINRVHRVKSRELVAIIKDNVDYVWLLGDKRALIANLYT